MKTKRAVLAGVILLAVIAAVLIAVLLSRPGEPGGPVYATIAADEFTLENSRGERLEFSRGELAGDMEAELPGEYREGEANQFELARGSDEYVFETAQERIELVLGNSEWEQAFEGSGVERAVFAPGAGLTLEGGLITGTVAVNYPAGAAYRPFRMDLCGEGTLSNTGALVVKTGKYTGRSANDKFIVDTPAVHDEIAWGKVNRPIDKATYDAIYSKVVAYLQNREIFVFDGFAGADEKYMQRFRIVSEEEFDAIEQRAESHAPAMQPLDNESLARLSSLREQLGDESEEDAGKD